MSAILDTSILSFYVSILGILGMISLKAVEIKSGKRSVISKLADKTNHIVHDIYYKIKKFFSYFNRKSALALVEWIAYHILSWVRAIYLWGYKKAHNHGPSRKIIDMVRGKGEINRKGGSSFYFKNLTHKDEEDKKDVRQDGLK